MKTLANPAFAPKLAGALLLLLIFLSARTSRASEIDAGSGQVPPRAYPPPHYQLAIGGSLAAGGQGYDAEEIAGLGEFSLRWQCLPALGIGASFGSFGFGRRGHDLQAGVVGAHLSLHPFAGIGDSHFDPYLRLGPLYFADVRGALPQLPTYEVTRFGVEGILGMNFAWRHVAFGPELRYGRTNQAWEMLGVHVEARF